MECKVAIDISDTLKFDVDADDPRDAAKKAMQELDELVELEGEAHVTGIKVYYEDAGSDWFDPKEFDA